MGTRYLVGDVTGVTAGLSVHIWGQQTETTVALHSGHPLEVGDRVYIAEIRTGIWMCLGPIETAVDYFPIAPEEEPEADPPPLVITAGTVTPDGNDIDLSNPDIRCPYTGSIPADPDRKVLTFTSDGECIEIPQDPTIISDPTSTSVRPSGDVIIVDASDVSQSITSAEIGVTLRTVSTLQDRSGNTLGGLRYQWYRDGSTIPVTTRDYTPTLAGAYRVGVSANVGSVIYTEVSSQTVTVSERENTPAEGLLTIDVSGTEGPIQGTLLIANTSGITDADGLANVVWNYNWQTGNTVSFDSSFTIPEDAAVGSNIDLTVTFNDDLGNPETKTASISVVARGDRPATGIPVIVGDTTSGSTLSVDLSGISDPDGINTASFTRRWTLTGVVATTNTYTIPPGTEVGTTINLSVTFRDRLGNEYTLNAAPISVTAGENNRATGSPSITGTVAELEFLIAGIGTVSDLDGFNRVSGVTFIWYVAGVERGRGTEFRVPDGTARDTLRLEASFTDFLGNPESRFRDVRAISARTRTPKASISVVGDPTDNSATIRLTADNPADWESNTQVIVRRGIGRENRLAYPLTGILTYSSFTDDNFDFILTDLAPQTTYRLQVVVGGVTTDAVTFTTAESEGTRITSWRVNPIGTNWFNIQGRIQVVNWDNNTQLRFRASRSSLGGPHRAVVTTDRLSVSSIVVGASRPQGNIGVFNYFDVPPCGNYILTAELFQNGVRVDSAEFTHQIRQANQNDLTQAFRNHSRLNSILLASGRVESNLQQAIDRYTEAHRLLDDASRAGPFGSDSISNKARAARTQSEQAEAALERVRAETESIQELIEGVGEATAFNLPSAGTSVVVGGGVVLAGVGITVAAGTVAATGSILIFSSGVGVGFTATFVAGSGWTISALGISIASVSTSGFGAGTVAIGTGGGGAGILGLPALFFATLASVLTLVGTLFVVDKIDDAHRDAAKARDLLFKPADPGRPSTGRLPAIPPTQESGALVELRKELADWKDLPIGRDNFQPIVDQALTFRNVVSGQVTRTDCR